MKALRELTANRGGLWYRSVNGASREHDTNGSPAVRTGLLRPGPEFDRMVNAVEGGRGTYYDRDHWLANYIDKPRKKFTPSKGARKHGTSKKQK